MNLALSRKKPDKALIIMTGILVVFGLVMLSSASIVLGQTKGDPYLFFKRQLLFGLIPGLILFYAFSLFEFSLWKKIAVPLLGISLILLVLVFLPNIGLSSKGASRWVDLGLFGFQPSEIVKMTFIIYLASWLTHKKEINSVTTLPFLSLLGIISILMILQPDIGTLSIIVIISLCMYLVSGAKISHIAKIMCLGFVALIAVILIAPYRLNRIKSFFNPSHDPLGISYQINQSVLAIGSGGIAGLGLGHSRQKFNYLPEVAGDAIFAIISEELGFVVSIMFLSLIMAIGFKGFRISENVNDEFGKLMAAGISIWIISQSLLNISSVTGILPFTGLPLPLVSHGGTAMVAILSGIGILTNISRHA